jgi:hypothetical protein
LIEFLSFLIYIYIFLNILGFEDEEEERAEFEGVETTSLIDGTKTKYYSSDKKFFTTLFINVSSQLFI